MEKTGAIVKIETEIKHLSALFERWNQGELNNTDMSLLIRRSSKKLDKINQICYCDENVCCLAHHKHAIPHQNCILR